MSDEPRAGCASEADVVEAGAVALNDTHCFAQDFHRDDAQKVLNAARALGCLLPEEAAALRAELVEAEQRGEELHDLATYETGGGGYLNWKDRAQAAERKLYDSGRDDWFCGGSMPGSFSPVPSYRDMRTERDALAARLKVAEEALRKLTDAGEEIYRCDASEGWQWFPFYTALRRSRAALTPAKGDAP